jgi:hypothetical protein
MISNKVLCCGLYTLFASRSVGKIPSMSFVILGSALSVLVTGYETYSRSRDASIVSLDRKLDADLKFMRKQRNFWVSLLLLVLWMYASYPFRFPFSSRGID